MLAFLVVVCGLVGGFFGIGYSALLDGQGFLAPIAAAWWTNEITGLILGMLAGYVVWRVRKMKMRLEGRVTDLRQDMTDLAKKHTAYLWFIGVFGVVPTQDDVTRVLQEQAEKCEVAKHRLLEFQAKGLEGGMFPMDTNFDVALSRLMDDIRRSEDLFRDLHNSAGEQGWEVGTRFSVDHLPKASET